MSSSILIRVGGLVAMVGGLVFVSENVLVPLVGYAPPDVGGTLYGGSLFFISLLVGAMTAVATIAVLYTLQRERYGSLGTPTSLVAFFGVALILVGELGLGTSALLTGLLLATLVTPVIGIITLAGKVLPWWGGAALIAGSPLFVLLAAVRSTILGLLGGAAWVLVGFAVFRTVARETQQPSRVR